MAVLMSGNELACGRRLETCGNGSILLGTAGSQPSLGKTPRQGGRTGKSSKDGGRAYTPRTLEEDSRQSARGNGIVNVVSASRGAQRRVDAVVDDGDDTEGVSEEWSSSCDGIEDIVESQTGRDLRADCRSLRSARETFIRSIGASDGETREIGSARSITEVVTPATGGQGTLRSGQGVERFVLQDEVFEGVIQSCERM